MHLADLVKCGCEKHYQLLAARRGPVVHRATNSNPNPNPISNKSICQNPNPNEIFDQLPYSYMDISRDQDSFSPISRQGSILTLCHGLLGRAQPVIPPNLYSVLMNIIAWGSSGKSWGVIRNQRSKIHRFRLVSTVGGRFRKILKVECRVI